MIEKQANNDSHLSNLKTGKKHTNTQKLKCERKEP